MNGFSLKTALAGLIFSLACSSAMAGTLAGQVGVRMVIGAGCSVINGSVSGGVNQWGTLDFGSHSDLTNLVDAQAIGSNGNIQIKCSTGLTPTLMVDAGLYASGSQRFMRSTTTATSTVAYSLYSDSARSALIQANTPVNIATAATGAAIDIPLYGRVAPTGQTTTTPAAGTYTDTLLVTIAW
ncbi:MAG: Csu type fimbrial protein [Pseudomonas piscis]|uniref:Csu type fimbrial protein n=1 Tax=Pseudomonas piscis TaxID=2614538 RepID=UPI003D27A35D